jgi:RHS repeat-associated protein
VISASGGRTNGGPGGGGGGGRVAIYYDTSTFDFATRAVADAGSGGESAGGVGTVYVKENHGAGVLRIDSHGKPAAISTPLGSSNDTRFEVDRLIVRGAGVVVMPQHQMPIVVNQLELTQGAVLTTLPTNDTQEYSLQLTVAGALTVDAASSINVTGKGYMSRRTLGNTTLGGAIDWQGGSYGGIGYGVTSVAALYGSAEIPNELGSGGSNYWHADSGPGGAGAGGGLIQITAGTAAIDGVIRADGNTGWGWDGWGSGGSGGGILINTGILSGIGVIQARGGNTSGGPGGGGGGGRIAVYTWNPGGLELPAANISVAGGTGGNGPGQSGTVVLSDAPRYFWKTPQALFHGQQELVWSALAVNPTQVAADVTAYQGATAYPLAVNRPVNGSIIWDTTTVPDGPYTIRVVFHDALGTVIGVINRQVGVNNSAAWHSGAISADTVWRADQLHIVSNTITIEPGATLTIEPGAIVKFIPGSNLRIVIKPGAALNAPATAGAPIILTSLADDSIGGDSGYDGYGTTPHHGDWYGFQRDAGGVVSLSAFVQQRYQSLSVACVTWQGGLAHETFNGHSTLLAAVVKHDQFPLAYTWDFGDGSPTVSGTINNQAQAYNLETHHVYPDSGPDTPYFATLRITDPSGNSATDPYPIVVRGDSLTIRRNVAIDEGLWWLHKQINRSGELGYWTEGGYSISATGSAVLAFENNAHLPDGDAANDPYVEDVNRGLDYLFSRMYASPIAQGPQCPHGNPDTNGNGIGINVDSNRYTYEIGPAMMAIAASGTPEAIVRSGPANIVGRTYREILTDMVDMCAWGQNEEGNGRGGWRYAWNSGDSDNSVTQWPILGIEAAEYNWGIIPPEFVKRELELFLTYSQDASGGWGYSAPDGSNNFSHAGAAIAGLSYIGFDTSDPRIARGLNWMNTNWNASTWGGTIWINKYAMYAVAKGLRTASPAVTMVGAHDWYTEFTQSLIAGQNSEGYWPSTSPWTSGLLLDTAFSILVLEPSILSRPPVAVLTASPQGARPGQVFTFDGSRSYHLDSTRAIVEYTFHFGDGTTYTETAASAPDGAFDGRTTHVYPDTAADLNGLPGQRHEYVVTMTIRDDDPRGAKTDQSVLTVTLSLNNNPPVANPGGPYVAYVGIPLTLSAIGSYDPDTGDPLYNHIASYGWQLTSTAPYLFNDATTLATNWTWNETGTYNIGLKVTDRFGASSIAWTTVEVRTGTPTHLFVRPERKADYQNILDMMAQLTEPTGVPIAGMPLDFYVDRNRDGSFDPVVEFVGEAITGADGWAVLPGALALPSAVYGLQVVFTGRGDYFSSTGANTIEVKPQRTVVLYSGDTVGSPGLPARLTAVLTDYWGAPIPDALLTFWLDTVRMTALTSADGIATALVDPALVPEATAVSVFYPGDANHRSSGDTAPFTISTALHPPILDPIPTQTVDEGGTLVLVGSFSDPDPGQTHTVTIDWGDGSPPLILTLLADARSFTASHFFAEEGVYDASVRVEDEDGFDRKSFQIVVNEVPVIATGGFVIRGMPGIPLQNVMVATFIDPGGAEPKPADPDPILSHHYGATIAWGDGMVSTGLIKRTGEQFHVFGDHVYATAGNFSITVTITHHTAEPAVALSTVIITAVGGILLLDPSAAGALSVSHGGSITLAGPGAITVDSASPRAVTMCGVSLLATDELRLVGGVVSGRRATLDAEVSQTEPVGDPLSLALPPPPTQTYDRVRYSKRELLILNPGTYIGGIQLSGHAQVRLNPGVYYLQGGGLRLSGKASLSGEGVLIINAPRNVHEGIRIGDRTRLLLGAGAEWSGPYAPLGGIVLMQDPTSRAPITLTGQAEVTLRGLIYAPAAPLALCNMQALHQGPGVRMMVLPSAPSLQAPGILVGTLRVNGKARLSLISPDNDLLQPVFPAAPAPARDPLAPTSGTLAGPVAASAGISLSIDRLITSQNQPVISGTAFAAEGASLTQVIVTVAGQELNATIDGNTWSVPLAAPLPDGTFDLRAIARDSAGNLANDATIGELTIDTQAPAPSMRRAVVNTATPTLGGMVIEANPSSGIAAVSVAVAGRTYAAALHGRVWSATITDPLPDGTYVVETAATDLAGNTGTIPPGTPAYDLVHYLTIDTAAPSVSITKRITNSTRPTLVGTVSDASPSSGITRVTLSVAGHVFDAVIRGGTWAATLPEALANGVYDVVATAFDTAGNVGTDPTSQELTIYTGSPVVTVDPLITSSSQPLLSGTVASLFPDVVIAEVWVSVGGQNIPADVSGGIWRAIPAPLADGVYDILVTAIDQAGNQAFDATTNELSVVTGAPVVTVSPLITNDATPTLSGTVNDPSCTVTVVVGAHSLIATVTGTSWSAQLDTPLPDGSYDVQVTAVNIVGTSGHDTTTQELTIDTVRPSIAVDPLITNLSRPMLSGVFSDPAPSSGVASIFITVAGQTFPATIAGSTWGAAVPAALADGAYDLELSITDRAGNNTTLLAPHALTIDTVPPAAGVSTLITSNSRPTLQGTVSDAAPSSGLAGVSIVVAGQTFSATVTGNLWSLALPINLADGTYDIKVTATDRAFNTFQQITAGALVIDTVAPVVAIEPLITTIDTPTLRGSVSDPAPSSGLAFVHVTVAGQVLNASIVGNSWSVSVPVVLAEGVYDVAAQAVDRAGNARSLVAGGALTIGRVPPVLQPIPDQAVTEGETLIVQAVATDPVVPPRSLTFRIDAGPAGASIDPLTGVFSWTPSTSPQIVGVTLTVTDNGAPPMTASQSFVITVKAPVVNQPPFITSAPPTQVTAGNTYTYQVTSIDPEGDPVTYALATAPAGMSIHPTTGLVTWTTTIANIGVSPVRIVVSDNHAGTGDQVFNLNVLPDIQAPTVSLLVSPNPANLGDLVTITVSATDNVAVAALGLTVNGTPVALDALGSATITASAIGRVPLVGSARDAAGNVGTFTTDLVVRDPGDTTPPFVALVTPTAGQQITSLLDVIGTVNDPQLVSYRLEAARVFGGTWQTLFTGSLPVMNGKLGVFDPSLLPNDSYTLRLSAADANGNTSSVETTIDVLGNLKLGNFRLTFTDLSIPVAGIPITVARIYDTLDITGGSDDFSPGWSLDFRSTNLRTNVPWYGQPTEGSYPPFFDGARVFVTLPGGRREGFTFRPTGPVLGFLYRPAFIPDPGVTSTLSGPNLYLTRQVNEYYTFPDGLPYNPADTYYGGQYTLTTKEGTRYIINGNTFQLDQVIDRNNNTLTFTDNAIISSAGPSVLFTRDAQGRITSVTDPMGQRILYTYNAQGDLASVTDREGNITQFLYNPARPHYLDRVIDPLGRTGLRTEYDDQGRLLRAIDANGNSTTLAYDPDNSLETITDSLGNPVTYEYDARGNIITQVDPLGGITRRTYDSNDNLLTLTDPLGRTTTFTYDSRRNKLTETDPLGHTTTYTYNSFGQVLTRTDPLGRVTSYTYDAAGNTLTLTYPSLDVVSFLYDGSGNLTNVTDPLGSSTRAYDTAGNLVLFIDRVGVSTSYTYDGAGNQTSMTTTRSTPSGPRTLVGHMEYDNNGRMTRTIDALGGITLTVYDAAGMRTAVVDPLGHRTEYEYDNNGDLTRIIYPDGTVEATLYDSSRRRIASIDRAGRITRYILDPIGRITQVIYPDDTPNDADNPRYVTEYDAAGQVIAEIDPRGYRTEYEYDAAGRRTLRRDPLGHVTRYEYDAADRLIAEIDPLGRRTSYSYDARDRVIRTTFPDGTSTSNTYDSSGNVIRRTDANGQATQYEYDALSRLTAVIDPLGQRTECTYDEADNLIAQRDANGHVTRFEYDAMSRLIATVLPLGQRATSTYNLAGDLISNTDFNGNTVLYHYDPNHRLTRKDYPDGSSVNYAYTPTGRIQSVTDACGITLFTYDARDRLLDRTDPDGRSIRYAYDLAGNRTAIITPSGTTSYSFDALNRLVSVTDAQGGLTTYEYDAASQLIKIMLPNGTTERREYDLLGRITVIEHAGPAGPFARFSYTLDPAGNRLAVQELDGRRVEYVYDALERLLTERIFEPGAMTPSRTIDYSYDPVGNRLNRDDSLDGLTTYTYDANDRLVMEVHGSNTINYIYGPSGDLIAKRVNAIDQAIYEWDFEHRLIHCDLDADATIDVAFRYDDQGNRVAEIVPGGETRYLVDPNQPYAQVIEEYTPGGVLLVRYEHGHDLISQNRPATSGRSFYHSDALGSSRFLTNDAAVITDSYLYDAFGRILSQSGSTVNPYLFTGEARDPRIGHDYLRARYYDPQTGRFTSRDSVRGTLNAPLSLNSYLYAHANPVMHRDPSGHLILEVAVGAALSILIAESLLRFTAPRARSVAGLEGSLVASMIDELGRTADYKALEGQSSNCSSVEKLIRSYLLDRKGKDGEGWKTLDFLRVTEWGDRMSTRIHHAMGIKQKGLDQFPSPSLMVDPISTDLMGQLPTGPLHKGRIFESFDWYFRVQIVFGPLMSVGVINYRKLKDPGYFAMGEGIWISRGRPPVPDLW